MRKEKKLLCTYVCTYVCMYLVVVVVVVVILTIESSHNNTISLHRIEIDQYNLCILYAFKQELTN